MENINKEQVQSMMSMSLDNNLNLVKFTNNLSDSSATFGTSGTTGTLSCWDYWKDYYYPTYIHHSYPVYVREQAKDKGRQAFELIKMLKDKGFVRLEKVAEFIDLMDELIKIL